MKRLSFLTALFLLVAFSTVSFAQITAPLASSSIATEYYDDGGQWPPSEQDEIFIFCANDPNGGELVAPNDGGCTFQWYQYESTTFNLMDGETNQTLTNIPTGGYRVVVDCGGTVTCYDAWVFVNQTFINANIEGTDGTDYGQEMIGCDQTFEIHGEANAGSNMTIYNPPANNFEVGPETEIVVCFSATHTWVSDLGFYLVAPGYGTCGTCLPSITGQTGTVELLPSVAAYDDGVTGLPESNYGCANPGTDVGTNCNNGDNVSQLCFTTELDWGEPALTACVCDMGTPLTSVGANGVDAFASFGPWDYVYGFDAGMGGWSVQIYDCIGADIGALTEASITFTDNGQCGESVIEYNSGPINSAIDDNSCSYDIASVYVVPAIVPFSYNIDNYIQTEGWNYLDGSSVSGSSDIIFDNGPGLDVPNNTTSYVYTAIDNYNCSHSDTVTYINVPDDATISPGDTIVCESFSQIIFEAPVDGGEWLINSTQTGSGVFQENSTTYPVNMYPQTNLIEYSIGAPCPASDQVEVTIHEGPYAENILTSCNGASEMFVSFDYYGVVDSMLITIYDAGGGTTTTSVTSNGSYTSPAIPSGTFTLELDNHYGCGIFEYTYTRNCGCITIAGTMDLTPIYLCEGEQAVATHNGNQVMDGANNDMMEFVIHDGVIQDPYAFVPIGGSAGISSDGSFFKPDDVEFGEVVYISPIAGPNVGGHVDTTAECYNQAPGVPVVWYQNPVSDIDAETMMVCGKTVTLTANTPNVGEGTWSCATCSEPFFTINNTSVNDETVTLSILGNYGDETFYWTTYNGICSDIDSVVVSFVQTPVAYAGEDTEICGTEFQLEAVLPNGSSGEWSAPDYVDFLNYETDNPNAIASICDNCYDTITFTWTETLGSPPNQCVDEDQVNIIFIPAPDLNLQDSASVCGPVFHLNAGYSGLDDDLRVGQWTWDANGYSLIIDDEDPVQDVTVSGNIGDSTTISFYWSEHNANYPVCSDKDTINVTFFSIPSANAGDDVEVCGKSVQLSADTVGAGVFNTFYWTTEGFASYFDTIDCDPDSLGQDTTNPGITNTEAWITLASDGAFGDTMHVEVPIFLIIGNAECKVMDELRVTFYQEPHANAGLDTSVCGLSYNFHAVRSLDSANSAFWEVLDGPLTVGLSWDPDPAISEYNKVNVPMFGDYVFEWTERNPYNPGQCQDKDTVNVSFLETPYPNAGDDFNVCGKNTCLNAIISSGGLVSSNWVDNGVVSFDDQSSETTCVTYNGNFADNPVPFIWVENNGTCAGYDTVLVSFYQDLQAQHQMDTLDGVIPNCGPIFNELYANDNVSSTSTASGYWFDVINNTDFFNPGTPDDGCEVDPSYLDMEHTFYWVVSNGVDYDGSPVCIDSSEAVRVYFFERPVADAGEDIIACGLTAVLDAEETDDYAFWFSNTGNVSFHWDGETNNLLANDSVTSTHHTYTLTPNYVPMFWVVDADTVFDQFNCTDIDTVNVIFAERPSARFYFNAPPCYGEYAEVWADISDPAIVDTATALFTWEWGDGVDGQIFGDTINGFGPGIHQISWDVDYDDEDSPTFIVEEDSLGQEYIYHIVNLRVENEYGCESIKFKDTIYEPLDVPWDSLISISAATCGDFNGMIELNTFNNTYSYVWDDGRIGDSTALTVEDLEGGLDGYYRLRTEYEPYDDVTYPVPPNARCTTFYNVYVPDTGEVIAAFDTLQFEIGLDGLADYDSIVDAVIQFSDRSTDAARTWKWTFYDEDENKIEVINNTSGNEVETDEVADQNPIIIFDEQGYYTARLVVTSREGCEDMYEYGPIFVKGESSLEIPNIFTPNGDGKNDVFLPGSQSMTYVHGIIMNRWGRKIYEWEWNEGDDEMSNGWDGTIYNSDRIASPGVYYYIIEGEGQDGIIYDPKDCETCKGAVHLILNR
jgi:gliding motility-associated-like protein